MDMIYANALRDALRQSPMSRERLLNECDRLRAALADDTGCFTPASRQTFNTEILVFEEILASV